MGLVGRRAGEGGWADAGGGGVQLLEGAVRGRRAGGSCGSGQGRRLARGGDVWDSS